MVGQLDQPVVFIPKSFEMKLDRCRSYEEDVGGYCYFFYSGGLAEEAFFFLAAKVKDFFISEVVDEEIFEFIFAVGGAGDCLFVGGVVEVGGNVDGDCSLPVDGQDYVVVVVSELLVVEEGD